MARNTYQPESWQPVERGSIFYKRDFGNFLVKTTTLSGLVGERFVSLDLEIQSNTSDLLVLQKAEIITESGRLYEANLPAAGDPKYRSVPGRESALILLNWDFEERAPDTLGQNPKVVLCIREGELTQRVEIDYQKDTGRS